MIGTATDIALIKELLRVDDDSDATTRIISLYMGAAEKWLANTGITVDYSDEQIVDAISMYVGVRYDEPEGVGIMDKAEQTLAAAAEQIRLSQLVSANASSSSSGGSTGSTGTSSGATGTSGSAGGST